MSIAGAQLVLRDEAEVLRTFDSAKAVAFDIETTGLFPWKGARITVVSLAAPGRPPAVLHYPTSELPDRLIRWLERRVLIGHNVVNFDIGFLRAHGYDALNSAGIVDTLVSERLAIGDARRDRSASLRESIKRRLGVEIDKSIDHAGWTRPELTEEQVIYAASDVSHIFQLYEVQARKIKEMGIFDTLNLERAIAPVIAHMVSSGMPLDDAARRSMLEAAAARQVELEEELFAHVGQRFNVGSSVQTKKVFKEAFKLDLPATDETHLLIYANQGNGVGRAAYLVLEIRKMKKRFMYDDEWTVQYGANGRMYYTLSSQGTATGRFSSSRFNAQQIPRDMHGMFGHPEGSDTMIVKADYSGIEVLVSGILMKEPALVRAMVNGEDVHRQVASQIFGKSPEEITKEERRIAKASGFTFLFGGGPGSIVYSVREGGVEMTNDEASAILQRLAQAYPNVAMFKARQHHACEATVTRRVPIKYGPSRILPPHENRATVFINNSVQGTAASGIKCAIARLKGAGIAQYARLTVHDELVLEVPRPEADEVAQVLERTMKAGMKDVIGVEPGVEVYVGNHWQ